MPGVSIILPTYNRADTISRAIDSVLRQTFQDWELIVIDDGSTDGTAALVTENDKRICLIRQDNRGCSAARNAGLLKSRGRLIAFLDSDDEWLPHFLEITTAFLRWSPDDHLVMTEFFRDQATDSVMRPAFWEKISIDYNRMAHLVGSRMLDLPPGETDNYLRVYQSREPLREWGRDIAARAGYSNASLYRGNIAEHFRWGYLGWLPAVVITRHALNTVGMFSDNFKSAEDLLFLTLLCRHFRANLISIPGAIKHATANEGINVDEEHLASGANEYKFAINRLLAFDELFWKGRKSDPEINRIRGLYQFSAGRKALEHGNTEAALDYLSKTCHVIPDLWSAYALRALIKCLSFTGSASTVYKFILRLRYLSGRLIKGEVSFRKLRRMISTRLGLTH